ncbi:DUF5988 family protein [Streptomyces sp. NPDC058614]|uniref:DUF5988 family protein n=1 Tax=Streptomyces sp. NPDC058614 TaxID=3346557 RepID=UPI00365D630B
MITIVVEGGPEGIDPVRRLDGAEMPGNVTVAYYGRHQHFEHTGRTQIVEGRRLPVFRFTYSTAIAE